MRALLLLLGSAVFAILPYASARWQRSSARPRQVIAISLLTLVGLAGSVILLLAVVVGPPSLPADVVPRAVGRCLDAAGSLFAHPLTHWPHILVSILVASVLGRLIVSAVRTSREADRWGRLTAREAAALGVDPGPDLTVVDSPEPLACTAGLLRPRILISSGLIRCLDDDEREAVIAHERAHVGGWHPSLLFLGRVVARSFGYLPPIRKAAEQLLLGLEIAADAAAVRAVGDPLILARALSTYASLAPAAPGERLRADGGDVVGRVGRLLEPRSARKRRSMGGLVVAGLIVVLTFQAATFVADASAAGSTSGAVELHAVCHLPHPAT